jgi:GxxExxY protein
VDNVIMVEVKAIRRLQPVHTAQFRTYLRLRRLSLGLLFNFNVVVLRAALQRVVNDTGTLRVLLALAVTPCSANA